MFTTCIMCSYYPTIQLYFTKPVRPPLLCVYAGYSFIVYCQWPVADPGFWRRGANGKLGNSVVPWGIVFWLTYKIREALG